MMKALIFDFETQDADPRTTRVTEIGAILYEVQNGKLNELTGINSLCYEEDYPAQSEKIVALTGITDADLKSGGIPRRDAFEKYLLPLVEKADILLAHKMAFDGTILDETSKIFGLTVPKRERLCTLTEFPWPEKFGCHKLGHLGWEHGLDFKATDLHRADKDCELLAALINKYNFDEILAYAREPWVYLKADICGPWIDNGFQKGLATSVGFSYEKCKGTDFPTFPKSWVRRVKERGVQKIVEFGAGAAKPFRISRIEGIQ